MATYTVHLNGKEIEVELLRREGSFVSFRAKGQQYDVEVTPQLRRVVSDSQLVAAPIAPQPRTAGPAPAAKSNAVHAPMPGIVVQVLVKPGDSVTAGQTAVIIEAMKMENNVSAPRAGVVKRVLISAGQEVVNHQELIQLE